MNTGDVKIFENKHPKLKSFAKGLLFVLIMCTLLFGFETVRVFSKTHNPKNYLLILGTAAVVSVIAGICAAAGAKKVLVKISDTTVDVTVGKAHGVYPVADYIGTRVQVSGGRNKSIVRELIFKDREDNTDLNIELPSVSQKIFVEIADTIATLKHEQDEGAEEYVPFEGDSYEGVKHGYTKKAYIFLAVMLIIEVILVALIVFVFLFFKYEIDRSVIIFISSFSAFFLVTDIAAFSVLYGVDKKARDMSITSLKIGSLALTVNCEEFAYRDIKSITMTPPYLASVSDEYRMLTVELKSSGKPRKFYFSKRPKGNKTEEQLSEGCSCIYPALYERMKTDAHTAGLFKK